MKQIYQRLRLVTTLLLVGLVFGAQSLIPVNAFACGSATGSSKNQVLHGVDQTGTDCSGTGVTHILGATVNILSIIVGVVAVIMIIVSSYRYITSGGDSNKVSTAKSTLIYALVGVALAALAQLLVHFVLYHASKAQ